VYTWLKQVQARLCLKQVQARLSYTTALCPGYRSLVNDLRKVGTAQVTHAKAKAQIESYRRGLAGRRGRGSLQSYNLTTREASLAHT
jgi:hypothetical protein